MACLVAGGLIGGAVGSLHNSSELQLSGGEENRPEIRQMDLGLLSALQDRHRVGEILEVSFPPAEALPYVSAPSYYDLISSYNWDAAIATKIACDESSFDPFAISWTGARGLFQIMPMHAWRFSRRGWDYWTDAFVPERNVAVAHELWSERIWDPWLSSWPWLCL